MRVRVYWPAASRADDVSGWQEIATDRDVPAATIPAEIRIPVMSPSGLREMIFRRVALEHGMAVYL